MLTPRSWGRSAVTCLLQHRRALIVISHVLLTLLANYLAFALRFEGAVPERYSAAFQQGLWWLLALRLAAFYRLHLFEGLWRYTGVWDLRNIIVAVGLSSAAFFLFSRWIVPLRDYPHSVYFIDALLLILFLGGLRLTGRLYRELAGRAGAKRVLIFGASDAGAMVAHEMKDNRFHGAVPVGFVDDDPAKRGLHIHGVRVWGSRRDLPRAVESTRPDEVIIAMPRASARVLREVVASLESFDLPIKILPSLSALLKNDVALNVIRPLAIEDLLERPPVGLDPAEVREFLHDRRVLVTGAGGSIGSELCRQIAECDPASLVMLDRYENGLYAVEHDVARRAAGVRCAPIIADVTDDARLDEVFRHFRPQIVFHAAAHKHVPLMEGNPCEAVKNNVGGTRRCAEAAIRHGVERFVLISSDKAVNPTSVMGATKRVAELIVKSLLPRGKTVFAAVRFGNVLGSNGSVVPLFSQQIKDGGPITVTDPEMRRFFMLIPEAVQLVLHAAGLARGGEVFVLDMGEPIKLVDMARNLIRLAGLRPGRDVAIEFIGLRPGEKLNEELIASDEITEPSGRDKIVRLRAGAADNQIRLAPFIRELETSATLGDDARTIAALRAVVPSFSPVGPNADLRYEPAVGYESARGVNADPGVPADSGALTHVVAS